MRCCLLFGDSPLAVGQLVLQLGEAGFQSVLLLQELFPTGIGITREVLALFGYLTQPGSYVIDLGDDCVIHADPLLRSPCPRHSITQVTGALKRRPSPPGWADFPRGKERKVSNVSDTAERAEPGTPDDEEVDDQFRAVMEGLRTTIPAVMVLFSFLLILPLQASFGDVSDPNTIVYYIAFASAAISSVLLISPSVHQRVRAPISGITRHTYSHVMYATKLALAGTVVFLVAIVAVVYLVSSLVFSDPFAVGASVVVAAVASWAWFYVPLVTFGRDD